MRRSSQRLRMSQTRRKPGNPWCSWLGSRTCRRRGCHRSWWPCPWSWLWLSTSFCRSNAESRWRLRLARCWGSSALPRCPRCAGLRVSKVPRACCRSFLWLHSRSSRKRSFLELYSCSNGSRCMWSQRSWWRCFPGWQSARTPRRRCCALPLWLYRALRPSPCSSS